MNGSTVRRPAGFAWTKASSGTLSRVTLSAVELSSPALPRRWVHTDTYQVPLAEIAGLFAPTCAFFDKTRNFLDRREVSHLI